MSTGPQERSAGWSQRSPNVINVEMTVRERELYQGLLLYAKLRYFSSNRRIPPGFVLVTRERQITSCLLASVGVLLDDGLWTEESDIGYEGSDPEIEDAPLTQTSTLDSAMTTSALGQRLKPLREILATLTPNWQTYFRHFTKFTKTIRKPKCCSFPLSKLRSVT